MIRYLRRLWLAQLYAWNKVDEYLARHRGDLVAASWSLNEALKYEQQYRNV